MEERSGVAHFHIELGYYERGGFGQGEGGARGDTCELLIWVSEASASSGRCVEAV